MNMQAILERIAARSAELGISEAALSQKGGSRGLLHRHHAVGKDCRSY